MKKAKACPLVRLTDPYEEETPKLLEPKMTILKASRKRTLKSKKRRGKAVDPGFGWMEESILPAVDHVLNDRPSVSTMLRVEHAERFYLQDVVLVTRTREEIVVFAVVPPHIWVARGIGTSRAKPLKAGDELIILGTFLCSSK